MTHADWHHAWRWCYAVLWADFMRGRDESPAVVELKYARDILEEALRYVAKQEGYPTNHQFRGPCSICNEEYESFKSRWSCVLCGRDKANRSLGDVLKKKWTWQMVMVCRDCHEDRRSECDLISEELNNNIYQGPYSKCDGFEYPEEFLQQSQTGS